jgi:outer membrane lipoprotein-sorting protein
MRSRVWLYVVIAVAAAIALVAGVVAVAGAGSTTNLPAISAQDLMAKMAAADGSVTSVSGEVSWDNTLFGDVGTASGMAQLPAQSALTSSGSGRIWLSDAGVRVESQGSGGDQVAGVSKASQTAWVYDSAANTAKQWSLRGDLPAQSPEPSPSAMTPATITLFLQQVAPYATVDVAGQATVAGRAAYLLRMTPVADDTALGAVQAAVDGETMMPLSLEVFAEAGGPAVLRFGFDSVSYTPVDPKLFELTPPAGAKVTTKSVDSAELQKKLEQEQPGAATKAQHKELARHALLTQEQAQELVDYPIASAQGYTARPFKWAYVFDDGMPLTALGAPVFDLAQMGMGGASGTSADAATMGPASVLLYGSGFGSIALAQTQTTTELEKQLEQLPALVGTATAGGSPVRSVTTPLGGVYIWQQGDTTLMASGMVPAADLEAFVTSVR